MITTAQKQAIQDLGLKKCWNYQKERFLIGICEKLDKETVDEILRVIR